MPRQKPSLGGLFDSGSLLSIYSPTKKRRVEKTLMVVSGAAVVFAGYQILRGEVKRGKH